MKILLIAYEFPPILAAQALRWFYLANELAARGGEIDVICPAISPESGFPLELDSRIGVHRVWPGPFVGLGEYGAERRRRSQLGSASEAPRSGRSSFLSRAYGFSRDILDKVFYPDVRTEWFPFARRRLKELLSRNSYDVVISSHEPAVDIFVGMYAKKKNIPWVVDMGDPLLTPYTPRWRRFLDFYVERRVLSSADMVWVTGEGAEQVLRSRHGRFIRSELEIVPQGFKERPKSRGSSESSKSVFRMVFTGNFYRDFRSPAEFSEALRSMGDVDFSLEIAGNNSAFLSCFDGIRGVHFLGPTNHLECLRMQGESDLLINIGNIQNYQIPGKLYEYLGAGSPILHIQTGDAYDPGARLIEATGAGVISRNSSIEIAAALRRIHHQWINCPDSFLRARKGAVIESHKWSARAATCEILLDRVCKAKYVS